MEKLDLLILFGGKSSEYEVSLVSASSIIKNADPEKYNIITVGITKDGDWYHYAGDADAIKSGDWCSEPEKLERAAISPSTSDSALLIFGKDGSYRSRHIDVIFPVMHGAFSEDGTLQGLLQISGIPFVGCKCCTSAIGMDKGFAKMILKNVGIHMARSIVVNAAMLEKVYPQILERCEQMSTRSLSSPRTPARRSERPRSQPATDCFPQCMKPQSTTPRSSLRSSSRARSARSRSWAKIASSPQPSDR